MLSLVKSFDPSTNSWGRDQVVTGDPLVRVRTLLGGQWTRSVGALEDDGAAAFWNSRNGRKVFVLWLPEGLPREAAERIARSA